MSDDWLSQPAMQTLLIQLVDATTQQYRIDPERASELIRLSMTGNIRLRQLVESGDGAKQIQRTRVYKSASAEAKREVYYALRRYHDDEVDVEQLIEQLAAATPADDTDGLLDQICCTHASTRERQKQVTEFHRRVFPYLDSARSLVDVGCGMHPLQFPFANPPARLETYVALDRDATSIRAVEALASGLQRTQLRAFCMDLADGWDTVLAHNAHQPFDVALMFKLVAVLQRHDRQLLDALALAPATTWLISGSTQSMTKRRDISRRERASILQFIETAERSILAEFTVGEEFVVVAE